MEEFRDFFGDWSKVIDFETLRRILLYLDGTKYYPRQSNVFKAFLECPFNTLKVVFLGQDPYPQKDVATGILFGNNSSTTYENYSPSLKVLVDSINTHYNDLISGKFSPNLTYLAHQGVLMLNSSLTVEPNCIGSHSLLWREFTSKLLKSLSEEKPNLIYVLFGVTASSFKPCILHSQYIIECPHPSYLARRNNNELLPDIFSMIDSELTSLNLPLIYWK